MQLPRAITTVTPFSKILTAVLFIILPFIGFWQGMDYQRSSIPIKQPTPPVPYTSPLPTSEPGSIIDWKIHRNKKFGFELRYPPDWKITEDNPLTPEIVIYSPDNLSDLVIAPISEARYTSNRNRDKKLAENVPILFAGLSAREYREQHNDKFTAVYVRDIQVEDTSDLNWTKPNEISYQVDKTKPDDLKIFDLVLSTFRFLDKEKSSAPNHLYSDIKLSGQVLENNKEMKRIRETDAHETEYIILLADDGKKYKIVYYNVGKFDACVMSSLEVVRTLKSGQKIELLGMFVAENEIRTCSSSSYYIHIVDNTMMK